MNALNTVPSEFIHVSDQEFENIFQADRAIVQTHFGKVVKQRSFLNQRCLSHLEASNFYAGYCMHSMMTTSFRFWSSDSNNSKDVKIWTRLVWQLAHVYPLGFLFSKYRFGNQVNESWNPLKKSASQFDRSERFAYQPSNRILSGAPLSQALYLKLFPDMPASLTSMQLFSLMDVFSSNPNTDNPLYVALRNALRHTIFKYGYPVPFFWEQYIEHLLLQSPDDLALYEQYKESVVEQDVSNVAQFRNAVSATQDSSDNPTPTEPTILNTGDVQPNPSTNDPLLLELAGLVKKSLSEGKHRINCQRALLHVVDDKYCFVHPLAFNEMANLYNETHCDHPVSKEQLIKHFTDNGYVLLIQGTLTPRNNVPRPIHLAELQSRLVGEFIPSSIDVSDNPDITLTKCL